MTPWKLLWRALDEAKRPPPGDLAAALGSLPEVGRLPSPWATWTLIGLVRHRRRQLWVAEVVADRLGGDPAALAEAGALAHPLDRPQRGLVPGLPEWEYFFHGIGCCLTHRITGESIDVDFYGPTAEYYQIIQLHLLPPLAPAARAARGPAHRPASLLPAPAAGDRRVAGGRAARPRWRRGRPTPSGSPRRSWTMRRPSTPSARHGGGRTGGPGWVP